MVGRIAVKGSQGLLDVVSASAGLSRAIMLGASALVGDEFFASQQGDNELIEEIKVEVDINEFETGGALALSTTLYSTAMVWTFRRMAIQARAEFLSDATKRIASIVQSLIDGKKTVSPSGLITFERQGLQNLEDLVASMQQKLTKGRYEEVLIDMLALKRQSQDIDVLVREFDDSFRVLQYANTLGGDINTSLKDGKMIGATESLFSVKDQARLNKIATSNQMFFRKEFGTNAGNFVRVGKAKPFDLFADRDLALCAELFLPKQTSVDDMYNIADDLKVIKGNLGAGVDDIKNMTAMIDNLDDIRGIMYLDEAQKGRIALTVDAMGGYLDEIRNGIMNLDDLVKGKMLPAVATAEKATESFLLRGAGKFVQGATYITLRSSLVPAAKSSQYATKVANGFKWGLKGLAKVFWVDSAIWIGTGLIDLAFLSDEEDTFWGERWGFSPIGEVIDAVFDLFIPEETQQNIAQAVDNAVLAALTTDTFGGLVQTILDVFINEVKITIVPADFILDEQDIRPKRLPLPSLTQDPLVILEVFTYAIVAKIVFMAWIRPAYNFFWGQATVQTT